MALTSFQRDICRALAARRRAAGESYVAGGVALNVALQAHRLSRDLDLFHDTTEAVSRSWDADRAVLEANQYIVSPVRERPGFVQATVSRGGDRLLVEWIHDSAYRFFPLVEHEELGLALHPFDLATNKVLALIGRLEVRDWLDVLTCHDRLQPLAYLAWAACGKDPGFSPTGVIDHARRSSHYSASEIATLAFDGPAPDAAELSRRWRAALDAAGPIMAALPVASVGQAVLTSDGDLFAGDEADLRRRLSTDEVVFHAGRVGGAWPQIRP
jgi:hypothetical protein